MCWWGDIAKQFDNLYDDLLNLAQSTLSSVAHDRAHTNITGFSRDSEPPLGPTAFEPGQLYFVFERCPHFYNYKLLFRNAAAPRCWTKRLDIKPGRGSRHPCCPEVLGAEVCRVQINTNHPFTMRSVLQTVSFQLCIGLDCGWNLLKHLRYCCRYGFPLLVNAVNMLSAMRKRDLNPLQSFMRLRILCIASLSKSANCLPIFCKKMMQASSVLNVLAQSCQQDEDFVGLIAGLSRTSVPAAVHSKCIELYLMNPQSKWWKTNSGLSHYMTIHLEIGPGRHIKTCNVWKWCSFFGGDFRQFTVFVLQLSF